MPAGLLAKITSGIPVVGDKNLLVGFDGNDDGAVYRLTDDIAIIQTLDFFPPMVGDPYIFGQIAAANALSDIAAMGGMPTTALNIVAFPVVEDFAILEAILRGGADKVAEAGAVLCGGHSINDGSIKYGLSVTGIVHPDEILHNNRCQVGDAIVLTKPLGVGILTGGYNAGRIGADVFAKAVQSMCSLNQHAFKIAKKYKPSSATDVTGFGFLGHLYEMVSCEYSIVIDSAKVGCFHEALGLADAGHITGGGIFNREFLGDKVLFSDVPAAVQEVLFDPQTSGGLLISVAPDAAEALTHELRAAGIDASIAGEVVARRDKEIYVF